MFFAFSDRPPSSIRSFSTLRRSQYEKVSSVELRVPRKKARLIIVRAYRFTDVLTCLFTYLFTYPLTYRIVPYRTMSYTLYLTPYTIHHT